MARRTGPSSSEAGRGQRRSGLRGLALGLVVIAAFVAPVAKASVFNQDDDDLIFDEELLHVEGSRLRRAAPNDIAPVVSPIASEENARVKRQFWPWSVDTDDEDEVGSAVEGSGTQDEKYVYRIKITVVEAWSNVFLNDQSSTYQNFASVVIRAITHIVEDIPGEKYIRVSKIEQSRDGNRLVTVDINSESYVDHGSEIKSRVRRALQSGRLESLPVTTSEFFFSSNTAPDIKEQPCTDQEIPCLGQCLPLSKRCNRVKDCEDGTDEEFCPYDAEADSLPPVLEVPDTSGSIPTEDLAQTETHPSSVDKCRGDDQFQCADGVTVICDVQRCDAIPDCPDKDDEDGCGCKAGEFLCDSVRCISVSAMCDGNQDCLDGKDERLCPCKEDEFKCPVSDTCISNTFKCNGNNDCEDGFDEKNCTVGCTPNQLPCDNNLRCFDIDQMCDGFAFCADGADERNCPPKECATNEFRCNDGSCIEDFRRCDYVDDCKEREDEKFCACDEPNFMCNTGHPMCIESEKHCNGVPDCEDGSDEMACHVCQQGQFTCTDKSCIPITQRCDGAPNCGDNSDEVGCDPSCTRDEFPCDDGLCLHITQRCNGRQECSRGEDEKGCYCSWNQFRCDDGTCISQDKKCDGATDCYDQSDERDCQCKADEWQCLDHLQCIPFSYRCDGRQDCVDASDETEGCPTTCQQNEFQCANGLCIDSRLHCDGIRDCEDGSDENCEDYFTCRNDQIIHVSKQCDGTADCADGSDEIPGNCGPDPSEPSDRVDLKTYPDQQTIQQSREVVFQCRDEGSRRAAVKWVREGGRLLPPGSTDIRGRLTMPNIQIEHSGNYYCEAQDVPGNMPGRRKQVQLRVTPFSTPAPPTSPTACGITEATCRNGQCIPKDAICDGDFDCEDGSDESRCNPLGCEPNEFRCDNQRCVLKTWLCDSDDDCLDNSDERNCAPNPPGSFCRYNEFACHNGTQCVPKSFHCDGEVDCIDGSDEFGCTKPIIREPPPRTIMIEVQQTFNITCTAIGIPMPTIVWRLNWGHVPDSCVMTSENGFGFLSCPNAKPTYQGAYSCEAINSQGSVFAQPDAIVTIKGTEDICQPPEFNAGATSPNECVECFCFGATDQCYSSDRDISQLPPPASERFQLVGVNQDQFEGKFVIRDTQYPLSSTYLKNQSDTSVQLRVNDRTRIGGPSDLLIYFSMPQSHKGAQLTSYGGYLRYTIAYSVSGAGQELKGPDVIIRGNGLTLMHVHDGAFRPSQTNQVDVRFWPGQWFKSVVGRGRFIQTQEPASRQEIMMVLENIDLMLIRALYEESQYVDATLSDVQLDTAVFSKTNQGQAVYVEDCRCPEGYFGMSCEQCAPNYKRVLDGHWLGRCVPDEECQPGEYGDPINNIPCLPCPCPLTNPANQFSESCLLDTDGQVTCNCPRGYMGRRCEICAPGYEGNPTVPGDYCKPIIKCEWYEFICGDMTKCLDKKYRCDGIPQCPDGSDETFCPNTTVAPCIKQFTCFNGDIHPWNRRCDGVKDCPTHEDEKNCDVCFNNGHLCGDRSCVPFKRICDGFQDCLDGSDELLSNCVAEESCPGANQWTCHDRMCIDLAQHCDGFSDCSDGSDEKYCDCLCEEPLAFTCDNGQCLNKNLKCNGIKECEDGSDERGCCNNETQFTCDSGACIDIRKRCNSFPDCLDHSDENNCNCQEYQFTCADGTCIDVNKKCDGRWDCKDGSDEFSTAGCCVAPANFQCRDGTCLSAHQRCDGYTNCFDGSDEKDCTGECNSDGSRSIQADPVTGRCQCKEFATGPKCDQCKPNSFYLNEKNQHGCINCFCMGITDKCTSSNWYRQQVIATFHNDRQGFELVDQNQQRVIGNEIVTDAGRQELVYRDFSRLGQDVYYWKLPQKFLGDKVTSYGGNLTYTLRYIPSPGGQRSRNNAYSVEIHGNDVTLRYYSSQQLEPNRLETVSVPFYDQYWQRQDGQIANREHFLMALADLEYIHIKATYTTNTIEAALQRVEMDIADSHNTNQERALAVEMCDCPIGHKGLSCEDCDVGYTRSLSDLYLRSCEPCMCNGHAEECHPETGECFNCRDNTAGDFCDECAPGYDGDAISGTCTRADQCSCNPMGSISTTCIGNRCQCKANVKGDHCDACNPGHFNLQAENPLGCSKCWCNDATTQCFSSNYYRMPIPMDISESGFTLINSYYTDVIRSDFDVNIRENEISFSQFNKLRGGETYYWSLPQKFTGNRLTSYGGNLTITQRYDADTGSNHFSDADIIIRSAGGKEFVWMNPTLLLPGQPRTYSVHLIESSFSILQKPATRREFLHALSSVEAILVRATLSGTTRKTYIRDVVMDSAVPTQVPGRPRAIEVEQCRCPPQYRGLSCEECAPGYYHDPSDNSCKKCECSGHEESCALGSDGRVRCTCLPGYSGDFCENSGPDGTPTENPLVVNISGPQIHIVALGQRVELRCSGQSLAGGRNRVSVKWNKQGGILPYDRAYDNRQGLLIISQVQSGDSGTYLCTASDGYFYQTAEVKLEVSGRPELSVPQVIIEERREEIEILIGEDLEITCIAEGNPPPQLQWTRGPNLGLPRNVQQANGVLYFSNLQVSDSGEYFCVATNSQGKDSGRIIITVRTNVPVSPTPQPPPPIFTVQLSHQDLQIRTGETARISCSSGNVGYFTTVWRRHQGVLPSQSTQYNGELIIPNVRPVDSGIYICIITDQQGRSEQSAARITVRQVVSLPSVRIEPDRQTINQGSNAELRCIALGDPTPNVTWSKVNEEFSNNVQIEGNSLLIKSALITDRGMYVCTAQNDGGTAQAAAIIEVERREPPVIEIYPEVKQSIVVGASALFQCHLTAGIPSPVVSWSRVDGQPITPNTEILNGGVLRFNQVTGNEQGSYMCTATNDAGSTTAIATLEILSVPVISFRPSTSPYQVKLGQKVRLECSAEGDPAPAVSWQRLQVNFPANIPSRSVTPTTAVYEIQRVTKADEGTYQCTARNAAGLTEERFQLLVIDSVVTDTQFPPRPPFTDSGVIDTQHYFTPQPPLHDDSNIIRVALGGRVEIQCHGIGPDYADVQLEWIRSDQLELPPDHHTEGGNLYINNAGPEAGGEYACQARDRQTGRILSTGYTRVEIVAPPRISLEPGRQVVRPGANVFIRCTASGDQPITINWTKETGFMPPSVIINGGELLFRGIAVSDAGRYVCEATNNVGSATAVAEVIVNGVEKSQTNQGSEEQKYKHPDETANNEIELDENTWSSSGFGETDDHDFLFFDDSSQDDYLYLKFEAFESVCSSGQVSCGDGLPCVEAQKLCDEVKDCPNGFDEEDCKADAAFYEDLFKKNCSDLFKCGDGTCYKFYENCDHVCDCSDCRDEKICFRKKRDYSDEEPLLAATQQEVVAYVGQAADLRCESSGINPANIQWSREGAALPRTAVSRGNLLRLNNVQVEDGGRYFCEARTRTGIATSDYITLRIEKLQSLDIHIRPSTNNVQVGEPLDLTCDVVGYPRAVIRWLRRNGALPLNARQEGNVLRFTSVEPDNGGFYLCMVTTDIGVFERDYPLAIQSPENFHYNTNARSVDTRNAPFGSSVIMECRTDLAPPVSYTWSKQGGQLPLTAVVQDRILEIPEVHAEDAGTYVCTARNSETSLDLPTLLVVTGVVPSFSRSSYLSLTTLPDAYLIFDLEISFRPDAPNGLIMYNGQRPGLAGDFVSFGMSDGHAEFRFDVGSGPAVIRSPQPIELGQWHTVKLSRNRKDGTMVVDGGTPVSDRSEGRFQGLDLIEPMYIGGVPDYSAIHRLSGFSSGFAGCISRLVIGSAITELLRDAQAKVRVASCDTCAVEPCQNGGVCQEAYTEKGHKCICPAGFSGEFCQNTGEACYPGVCGTGRCINKPGGFECFCPFGKTGMRCEQEINIYEPSFEDGSYIAYPTPRALRRFSVGMNLKPQNLEDGVLMYCAQKERGDGDFTSLALRNKRLEFKFNTGTGTATLQSEEIKPGEWIKVHANRTDRLGSLTVNDGEMMNAESPGLSRGLNLRTPLFIGGVDTSRVEMSPEVQVTSGFYGCVSEIKIQDQEINLSESLVDSANVGQCGGMGSPCSREPCFSQGQCIEDNASPQGYRCICPEGFSGLNCEEVNSICSSVDPCLNDGICQGTPTSYICQCPLGFAGQHCEHSVDIIDSSSFSGQSWIEFDRNLFPQTDGGAKQWVTLEFSTVHQDGLLFWYGQGPNTQGRGKDFVSLAMIAGYLEFSYELGTGPAIIRSVMRYDDGDRHSVTIRRTGRQGSLEVDGNIEYGDSPGSLHMLNAEGNIYIGGVPNHELMTGGQYLDGFQGCIHSLSIDTTTISDILQMAISGVNVTPCPSTAAAPGGDTHVSNSFEEHHFRNGTVYKRKTYTTAKKTTHTSRRILPSRG